MHVASEQVDATWRCRVRRALPMVGDVLLEGKIFQSFISSFLASTKARTAE